MHYLIRRLLGDITVDFEARLNRSLAVLPGRKPPRPLPDGHGARALYAMETAESEGFDMLVFGVDADTNLKREWNTIRRQIVAGFKRSNATLKAVACVPMSTSESWLLADAEAWRVLGLRDVDILPPHPEVIWGPRDDPDGNHPHRYFARVCASARRHDDSETRWKVAEEWSLTALTKKCPISFIAFRDDLT
jgi:hypothetical protein